MFLSHDKTKTDITNSLAAEILEYNSTSQKLAVTFSSGHTCTRSNKDRLFPNNNHEKADTLFLPDALAEQ